MAIYAQLREKIDEVLRRAEIENFQTGYDSILARDLKAIYDGYGEDIFAELADACEGVNPVIAAEVIRILGHWVSDRIKEPQPLHIHIHGETPEWMKPPYIVTCSDSTKPTLYSSITTELKRREL